MPPRRGVRLPLGSPAALGCCCPLGQAGRAACSRVPKSESRGVPRRVPRAPTAARAPALWLKMGCCVRGSALGWMMLVPRGKLRMSNAGGLEPLLSLAQVRPPRRAPKSETLERRLLPLRREAHGQAICMSKTHNFARRKGKDEEYQTAKPGKLEKLHSPLNWPCFWALPRRRS